MNTTALEVLNTYTQKFEKFARMFYVITINNDELALQGDATKQTIEFFQDNMKVDFQLKFNNIRGEYMVGDVYIRVILTLPIFNEISI